jgi:hypothetical protein
MDVNSATSSSINYGIGGNYLGSLQTGLTPVMTSTTTPFPPDAYTPTIFGSAPPSSYETPRYQVPPQSSYYQGPGAGGQQGGTYTYDSAKASLASADTYLDKKRQEAINQGRPDLLAQINERQDQVEYEQERIEASKPEDTKS